MNRRNLMKQTKTYNYFSVCVPRFLSRPLRCSLGLSFALYSLLFSAALLTGCSDDSEQEKGWQTITFEAQPSTTAFEEEDDSEESRSFDSTTRSWNPPTGYYLYDNPDDDDYAPNEVYRLFEEQKNMFYKSIDAFFTRDGKETLNGTFSYKTSEHHWRLNMDIPETGDYYVYGYIPKEVATSASITGNSSYSNGAVLTINGIKTVTHSDVSVIVGAKDGPSDSNDNGLTTGQFTVNAKQVQIGAETGNHNYIYLLFDHLYSALAFNFKIDPTYNELRTIKVRKLELIGYLNAQETNIPARYNVEVKLKSNTTGASPIESVKFTADPTSGNLAFEPIYEGEGVTLDPVTPTPFMGCFVPGQNTYFKLRTTYDVYDKNPQRDDSGNIILVDEKPVYNLIREGCEAENKINLNSLFSTTGSLRGQMFQITIKVVPTYLYVLSEPDLDNPTMTIGN